MSYLKISADLTTIFVPFWPLRGYNLYFCTLKTGNNDNQMRVMPVMYEKSDGKRASKADSDLAAVCQV